MAYKEASLTMQLLYWTALNTSCLTDVGFICFLIFYAYAFMVRWNIVPHTWQISSQLKHFRMFK